MFILITTQNVLFIRHVYVKKPIVLRTCLGTLNKRNRRMLGGLLP